MNSMAEALLKEKDSVREIAEEILQLRAGKAETYGLSWRKYGWLSIFPNIARKWDRFENQFRAIIMPAMSKVDEIDIAGQIKSTDTAEGIRDSLVDLVAYGLMAIHYLDETTKKYDEKVK